MVVLLVGLVRCGGETPTVVIQPEAPVPTTIEVSPSPLLLFSLGGSVQATATVLDQFGDVMTTPVVWTSSADSVAAVDAQGLITIRRVGTAVVRVTAGSAMSEIQVLIGQKAARVETSATALTLGGPGAEEMLAVTTFDAGDNEIPDATIDLVSLDEAVATVSALGAVTAVAPGSTTIVVAASSQGTTVQADVLVTVFAALAVAPVTIPPGVVGVAYETVLSATGGDGVYSWSVVGGALPPGLTLAGDGTSEV